MLGARADPSKNERDSQQSDARACSEKQISNCSHGGAGCEHSCPTHAVRQLGCGDLESRHHAGVERAQ
jgi:hypothetical protein